VVATFRRPFDLLAETTAIAARHGAGNTAKRAKSEIWLGDLDSNQDYRSQSRFPGPMVSADSAPHLSQTITIALP
jgi:hypothetical protein